MSKQEVYDRDGGKCFFCGVALTFEKSTHEHILATQHGGNNSNANCTIACQPCNLEAGALPIVEKIKLREAKHINSTQIMPPLYFKVENGKLIKLTEVDI